MFLCNALSFSWPFPQCRSQCCSHSVQAHVRCQATGLPLPVVAPTKSMQAYWNQHTPSPLPTEQFSTDFFCGKKTITRPISSSVWLFTEDLTGNHTENLTENRIENLKNFTNVLRLSPYLVQRFHSLEWQTTTKVSVQNVQKYFILINLKAKLYYQKRCKGGTWNSFPFFLAPN